MLKWACPLLVTLFLFGAPLVFAYDNKFVHPAINENATNQSILNNVLQQLGFTEGIEERFDMDGNTATEADNLRNWEWISKGGTDEDTPDIRPIRHFHDPIKDTWSEAGLYPSTYDSALVWAQKDYQPAYGTYSWPAARLLYYQALITGLEEFFAKTFLTLGHVMHLLSDMAVPAHVRNDEHLDSRVWGALLPVIEYDPDQFEQWTKKKAVRSRLDYNGFAPDASIFKQAETAAIDYNLASIPISALWDQNVYQGSNPDPALTWASNVGLAEFTNANFFSNDTIYEYQHPDLLEAYIEYDYQSPLPVTAEDNKIDTPVYIYRRVNADKRYRLAALDYFAMDVGGSILSGTRKTLDENVFQDYAGELIPRAVGYSAALLDYFFRGNIDMVADPSGSGYIITNNSDEEMNGTFALYYDDINGDRHPVSGAEWELTINPGAGEIAGESTPVSFIPPTFPAPEHPGKYMLVFDGRMGNEEGAVVGKVIAPPVPYLLVKMSTKTHGDLGIPQELLPDIVVAWDMATNDFARILDINGELLSFPMEYDDFISTDFFAGTIQFGNVKPLFTDYSMFTDTVPDCNVQSYNSNGGAFYGCPDECENLSSCSYPDFFDDIDTDSCTNISKLPGGINAKSSISSRSASVIFEHLNMRYNDYDDHYHYNEIITYTRTSTYEENVEVQVAGEDISPWGPWSYGRKLPVIFLLKPHKIEVLNNSNAESKYITTQISWKIDMQTLSNGIGERDHCRDECRREWNDYDSMSIIDINLQNSFFDWSLSFPWSSTREIYGANTDLWWWDEYCGEGFWNPPANYLEIFKLSSNTKNYMTGDITVASLQSHDNEYYQYQVGLFYLSNRQLTNVFNHTSSYDGINETQELTDETTDGPIQTEVRAFCSLLPPEEGTALTVNPWTLPYNVAFQNAVHQMVEYFANHYGIDPRAINPEYFNNDLDHEQNIWDREFYLRTIYINNL